MHRGRGGKVHQRHQRYLQPHSGEVADDSTKMGDFLGEDRLWKDACRMRNRGTIIVLTTLDRFVYYFTLVTIKIECCLRIKFFYSC